MIGEPEMKELEEFKQKILDEKIDNMLDSKALSDVLDERIKQIEKFGFDAEHDDANLFFSMSNVGALYALYASSLNNGTIFEAAWPSNWDISWWKPESQRTNLVKAAALILAEIEAIDRQDLSEESAKSD